MQTKKAIMQWTDIATPVLGFLLFMVPIYFVVVKKDKMTTEQITTAIIGFLIMATSINSAIDTYDTSKDLKSTNDSLLVSQQRVETGQKDLQIAQLKNSIAQRLMSDSQNEFINRLYIDDSANSHNLGAKIEALRRYSDSLISLGQDPVLDILPEDNPVIKREWNGEKDNLIFVISEVIEKATSTDEIITLRLFGIKNDNVFDLKSQSNSITDGNIHHYQKSMALSTGLKLNHSNFKEYEVFAYIKVSYKNMAGKQMKPLIRVYKITPEYDVKFKPNFEGAYKKIISFIGSEIN